MKRNKCEGFSIIELLVVLLFFGAVISATLSYSLKGKDRRNLSATARLITGEIYKIKQISARENMLVRMTFTTDTYSYQYYDGAMWQDYTTRDVQTGTTPENIVVLNPPDFAVNSRGMTLKPGDFQLSGTQTVTLRAPRGAGYDFIYIRLFPYGGIKVEKKFN
jgi:type II secretory pathway pseudopilin PulG